jgi:hypothetical protein
VLAAPHSETVNTLPDKALPVVLRLLRERRELQTRLDIIDRHVLVRSILGLDYGDIDEWKETNRSEIGNSVYAPLIRDVPWI